MKRERKEKLIAQLKKTPVIQVSCDRTGIGRATYYRWHKEDSGFAKAADEAILAGALLVNDMAESQLIAAIRERNLTAIIYWLKHHHPAYTTRIELSGKITASEELTPQQETLVQEALRLASLIPKIKKENGKAKFKRSNPRIAKENNDGQKGQKGSNS